MSKCYRERERKGGRGEGREGERKMILLELFSLNPCLPAGYFEPLLDDDEPTKNTHTQRRVRKRERERMNLQKHPFIYNSLTIKLIRVSWFYRNRSWVFVFAWECGTALTMVLLLAWEYDTSLMVLLLRLLLLLLNVLLQQLLLDRGHQFVPQVLVPLSFALGEWESNVFLGEGENSDTFRWRRYGLMLVQVNDFFGCEWVGEVSRLF